MKKIAVFPGSFDPFTKGHEDIVSKALLIFDEVIIGVGHNVSKKSLFSLENRVAHMLSIYEKEPRVKVEIFSGLTVDFCREKKAQFLIRGLRDTKDFEYEKSIAQMNRDLAGIESLFIISDAKFSAVSSTIIREIYKSGGEIDAFVTNWKKLV